MTNEQSHEIRSESVEKLDPPQDRRMQHARQSPTPLHDGPSTFRDAATRVRSAPLRSEATSGSVPKVHHSAGVQKQPQPTNLQAGDAIRIGVELDSSRLEVPLIQAEKFLEFEKEPQDPLNSRRRPGGPKILEGTHLPECTLTNFVLLLGKLEFSLNDFHVAFEIHPVTGCPGHPFSPSPATHGCNMLRHVPLLVPYLPVHALPPNLAAESTGRPPQAKRWCATGIWFLLSNQTKE